ncbi:hypothetical protein ACGFZP_37985, partial [Kitasatospora sp. NPDC048239]|uniref:hypothetical protein n=1 Tax=Kitasatospora sp. NPDC048239 TaxID=3364046 RepID=UPI00371963D1
MDDEPFPGIVEVRFIDATGRCWSLIDKCPIFAAHLGAEAQLTVPDAAWSARQLSVVRLAFLLLLAGLVGPGAERSGQAGLVGADWRAPPPSRAARRHRAHDNPGPRPRTAPPARAGPPL